MLIPKKRPSKFTSSCSLDPALSLFPIRRLKIEIKNKKISKYKYDFGHHVDNFSELKWSGVRPE
jgi:hypothetical protein